MFAIDPQWLQGFIQGKSFIDAFVGNLEVERRREKAVDPSFERPHDFLPVLRQVFRFPRDQDLMQREIDKVRQMCPLRTI